MSVSYPCSTCGKYSFPRPTKCFWCADTRTEAEKAESVREGVARAMDPGYQPPPPSAFEEARLKLHKYRRHEARKKKGGAQ